MTSSGTRGPRPMPSTCGGGTWSYQPPKSSQVTKIAVELHSELCMIAFTIEDTKFCAGCVACGGWSDWESWPGMTKLMLGRLLLFASVMIWLESMPGVFLRPLMYCGASHTGAVP